MAIKRMFHLFQELCVISPHCLQCPSLLTSQSITRAEDVRLNDLKVLFGRSGGLRRFLVRLQAKRSDFCINKPGSSACGQYAKPVFVIHDQMEILAERANFLANPPRPKHLGLNEISPLPPDTPEVQDFVVSLD